jgi:hypothetical protein
MKYFLTATIFLATLIKGTAQTVSKKEMQIRLLEQTVVTAILNADTNTLKNVWAPEFLVNNPRNKITGNRDSVLISQKAGMIDYSTFERIIERIQFQKNIVTTMGYEIFVSRRDIPEAKAGQTYKRRFTNIWMKKKGKWQQIARHASIICQ